MTPPEQLAALAQAEAALHLATVKRHKEPRNDEWRREQAALQETVQTLRYELFGQDKGKSQQGKGRRDKGKQAGG